MFAVATVQPLKGSPKCSLAHVGGYILVVAVRHGLSSRARYVARRSLHC